MAIWPASIQQEPLFEGLEEDPKDNVIVGSIPAGQDKRRKISTAVTTKWNVNLVLTETEYKTLRAFYNSNTVTEFLWVDPEDLSAANVVFASRPKMLRREGDLRLIGFIIEVQL
jgi:hypothetical protein